jgi:hypothetical protein
MKFIQNDPEIFYTGNELVEILFKCLIRNKNDFEINFENF